MDSVIETKRDALSADNNDAGVEGSLKDKAIKNDSKHAEKLKVKDQEKPETSTKLFETSSRSEGKQKGSTSNDTNRKSHKHFEERKNKSTKSIAKLDEKKSSTEITLGSSKNMKVQKSMESNKSNIGIAMMAKAENMKKEVSPTDDDCHTPALQKSQTPINVGLATGGGTSATTIPDNMLSPPKSETQTDETNTATSSSPASDSQLSPKLSMNEKIAEPLAHIATVAQSETSSPNTPATTTTTTTSISTSESTTTTTTARPINVVANGTIPKSGKPLMSTINKKSASSKSTRTARPRKQKALVAMYESEISHNKVGIKLCIKKSDTLGAVATAPANASADSKQNRKRSRKTKTRTRVDSDDSEYETKRRKERGAVSNNNNERQKKVSFSGAAAAVNEESRQPVEQTEWGARLPEEILYQIFQIVVEREGCLPTLCRLGRVCSLWRRVSLSPTLWKIMDLSTWIKEKYRTELKLKWFIDNRCSSCTELNVSSWKVSDINCFLGKLSNGCPNLEGITLSGWKNFTSDHLTYLVDNMKKLQRLDLSSVNVEMNASKSAVGLLSLCNALQTMNGRLTHLYLAHNRLAGIPQIVNILSKHCPNLLLLDLSNVTTQATSHGILHIEKLQHGCQKLRVLRVTNSHITLSTASMQEMMDSPGFPDLEELSVAALTDESRVFGDEHLQRILKTSSQLKLLDVRNCSRLTHESLIRLPAWDIKHLFLSGCSVTRDVGSGLELIASKWAHSLIELDLAWANVQQPLDNALRSLAEKGSESPLAHLNLCGSSVSEGAVKDILANCAHMSSLNLSSCRGLPRGVKRLMQAQELPELREVLKVQMKVKLPSQLKEEAEKKSDGVGGGSSGSCQSN